ncbi:PilZ domain-containing protein [Marinimicrobium sp. ABcell2]|uniref:PilZ domain-containing protein n=1 Tax=Marinimicrobium sp. ABcell2 TaxID=3069751 RepID=UPI0027B0D671|nr:PilZ domain-containing protein [Marinimicrobium sp. ABcell2]MDQ2075315.1 PilZ domain-containing protein [Marinimicrobium sp. ABcell2]
MEHRKTQRVPAHINVLIYQRGLPVSVATVRNISKGGMFVATDFEGVDINQKLDVEFRLAGQDQEVVDSQWVSAIVVRKSEMGLALECDDDSEDFRSEAVAEVFYWLRSATTADVGNVRHVSMA